VAVAIVGFLLLQLGQLHPWVRVNAEEASAERFASLVAMNTGTVPPWNTFRSLENLRSYHASCGDVVAEFDVLRQQYRLGIQPEKVYRAMQVTFPRLPGSERVAILDTMLTLLIQTADAGTSIGTEEMISPTRLRELAASTLLLATSEDEHVLVQRNINAIAQRFPSWPEVGLYYAAANAALTDEQRREIAAMSLTPESSDPSLTASAGWFCEKGHDVTLAIVFYRRTIALAPGEYPGVYLRLARLLSDAAGQTGEAVRVLEQGLAACPYARERTEIMKLLADLKTVQ
jgi:hypothetical protein